MTRWILLLSFWLLWPSGRALANDMDLALARLKIAAEDPGCERKAGFCPDLVLFERLASELAIAASPPLWVPASSRGMRGTTVGVTHTFTTIRSGARHWRLGTRGGDQSLGQARTSSPDAVLHWTRIQVRKGLPFGLELGGHIGHGLRTSMWSIAGQLKLAIFEGFRSGLGHLPDLALAAGTQGVFGSPDVGLFMQNVDVILSKSYVVGGAWRINPLLAGQLLLLAIHGGFVDLDRAGSCQGAAPGCMDTGYRGPQGVARFPVLHQVRLRAAAGAEFAHDALMFVTTAAIEAPGQVLQVDAPAYSGRRFAVQLAVTAGAAVEF